MASPVHSRPPKIDPTRQQLVSEAQIVARIGRVGAVSVVVLAGALVLLLGRVVHLQASPDGAIASLLDTQTSRSSLLARRGALLDRRDRPLAVTRVAQRLFVDPALIVDRNTFSEHIAYNLDYDPVVIEKAIAAREASRYVVLDQRLSDRRASLVRSVDLPGLETEPILVRDYPQGRLAGQVVGFVGRDGNGLAGLEMTYERQLASSEGNLRFLRDARRRPLWVASDNYHPQRDGQTVRLSIDVTIQDIAERQLAQTVEKYRAKSGQIVVMDPVTGEILAMANYPLFDPAAFSEVDPQVYRNRAVTDVFEPGSIFKPFVWAGLTAMNAARPEETFDCTEAGVWRTPYGRRLRDAHGLGRLTWDGVLIKSSNIGMAQAAERVTPAQLHHIVTAFGFGQPTASTLPGEIGGIVHPLPKWTKYSQSSVPMGQEVSATALQLVRAFCVLANDGLLVTPTIEATDGPARLPLIQERVIAPGVAAHTRQVLRRVVTEGTGRKADSGLYAIFGKTGTAQLPNFKDGGYHQDRYVSSFLAGAPLEAPRVVVGCFIQDPDRKVGHYGGIVAAPPVKDVIEQTLTYLGVAPSPGLAAATTAALDARE